MRRTALGLLATAVLALAGCATPGYDATDEPTTCATPTSSAASPSPSPQACATDAPTDVEAPDCDLDDLVQGDTDCGNARSTKKPARTAGPAQTGKPATGGPAKATKGPAAPADKAKPAGGKRK